MARALARAATGPLRRLREFVRGGRGRAARAKGWVLQPQIGVSGFRIDLASPWASGHAPRQQAEHMIAIDLPVRILFEFLEPEGPSTHGFWLEEFAARTSSGTRRSLSRRRRPDSLRLTPRVRNSHGRHGACAIAHTMKLSSVEATDYDAVFYPGGHGPLWDLAEEPRSIHLIETIYAAGKPFVAICHSPGMVR